MGNLSVQQTKQLDVYLKKHKNVSREQAIKILFPQTANTKTGKGIVVERTSGGKSLVPERFITLTQNPNNKENFWQISYMTKSKALA